MNEPGMQPAERIVLMKVSELTTIAEKQRKVTSELETRLEKVLRSETGKTAEGGVPLPLLNVPLADELGVIAEIFKASTEDLEDLVARLEV